MAVDADLELNEKALQQYTSFQFVPEPETLDKKVQK